MSRQSARAIAQVSTTPLAESLSSDALMFYSGSADKAPGKGASERITHPDAYLALAVIPHWRRTLSNFHEYPFQWHNSTWRTIEHAYQATKLLIVSSTAYHALSVEYVAPDGANVAVEVQSMFGNEDAAMIRAMRARAVSVEDDGRTFSTYADFEYAHVGSRTGLDARLARKMCELTSEQIAFWGARSGRYLAEITRAKYAVCPEARAILLATGNAQLLHRAGRSPLVRFDFLETLRSELRLLEEGNQQGVEAE
ncbi:hypothetical protein BC828DRAFT_240807 [Blastocladiella britannica]|nr:hypothetical protein BC828DRAFT_240807 [Blastocladiella britannica]